MRTSRLGLGFMLCSAATWSLPAHAEDQASAESGKLFEAATKAHDAKDYALCVTRSEEAWQKFQHAQIRGLQGLCELELGKYVDAATHLSLYVNGAASAVEPEMRSGLARAKERVAEVSVACHPEGAEITVDGNVVGKGSTTVFLEPGAHTIDAKNDGLEDHREKRDLAAGTKITIAIELTAATESTSARPMWPGILGLSLAGGALVTGIATTIVSNGASSDAKGAHNTLGKGCSSSSPTPACKDAFDSQSKANTFGNVAVGMYITAGVLAAASIPYVIWASGGQGRRHRDDRAMRFTPIISPAVQGFTFQTAF